MCITFTFKHFCGHEHSQHNIKCLHAIKSQLNLSQIHTIGCAGAKEKWECLGEADLPREYIKPGICESCRRTGLVANFFENSPGIEYEILRQWRIQKRMLRAEQNRGESESVEYVARTLEHQTQPSESSIESRGPGTPETTVITAFEHISCDLTPETLSPVLYDSISQKAVGGGCDELEDMVTAQDKPGSRQKSTKDDAETWTVVPHRELERWYPESDC